MKLRDVLDSIPNTLSAETLDRYVTAVTSDSRELTRGCVFVAIRGAAQDGHEFIPAAAAAGASLIVGEIVGENAGIQTDGIPYLQVEDSRRALALLVAAFYGHPSRSMTIVGVTGTSGKTTTTYLIEAILKAAGRNVGVIGTVNFRFGEKVYPSTHTTPGPVELQKLLAAMRRDGCDTVVMEVSSHALKQHRVGGIAFDGMIFTNLSPEHLDFHPDMEDYYRSKAELFTTYVDEALKHGKKPFAAINGDDDFGRRLGGELGSKPRPGFRYGFFLQDDALRMSIDGIEGKVLGVPVRTKFTGKFNMSNIQGAVVLAKGLGIPDEAITRGLGELPGVPGRLEPVMNSRGIHVFVDYAHKSDALEKVLKTLKDVQGSQRLITVFGCGGDRDRQKRPVMGRIAAELSSFVFVTSDNPRTEEPRAIIDEILAGMTSFSNYMTEPDRRRAIHAAIETAVPGDIVLIAGKGHEDYQIIGKEKIHFDDREVAAEALSKRSLI